MQTSGSRAKSAGQARPDAPARGPRRIARWACPALAGLASALWAATPPADEAARPVADVRAILALIESGRVGGAGSASNAMAEALLRAFDPGARLLASSAEAEALAAELAGLPCGPGAAASNPPPCLRAEALGEGLSLVRVAWLPGAGTPPEPVLEAARAGTNGLILDLRGAGGTNLACVDAIASVFYEPDTFLYSLRGGQGDDRELRSAARAPRIEAPAMLLVDGATRGAAELLAALLERAPGVMVLGAPTAGDARWREVVPLGDDVFAYLAVGRFELADGSSYEPAGVSPDVLIDRDGWKAPVVDMPESTRGGGALSDEARLHRELYARVSGDPALARATDILLGLRALNIHAAAPASHSER